MRVYMRCNSTKTMKRRLERWLLNVWYGDNRVGKYLLLPLTGLFCLLSAVNRRRQLRQQIQHPLPVVVVGNIAVGGTGKTPLVIWLVEQLRAAGFKPGVVSRGHGRQVSSGALGLREVAATDSAAEVGDEPLLIVQRTGVPLIVDSNRNRAISRLLQQSGCDIVIADDGLQHYRMGRALEICVVDGQRRCGNGLCLPAGPLREPVSRLSRCDYVITNGGNMRMQGERLVNLMTQEVVSLAAWHGRQVHVVTGIGNPQRFINALEQAGLQAIPHVYPDHHAFSEDELLFSDDLPVLMTEKDAVKCRLLARQARSPGLWYLPVTAVLDEDVAGELLDRIQSLRQGYALKT